MQHCRFHFAYYPDGYDRDWSDIEPDEMDSETGEYPIHRDWDEIESCYTFEYETYSETPPIELRKAEAVFKESRWMPMCEGCEETFTAASQGEEVGGRCRCDMWAHFVGKGRLCIPCFFVEETKAYEDVQWKVGADGKSVRFASITHTKNLPISKPPREREVTRNRITNQRAQHQFPLFPRPHSCNNQSINGINTFHLISLYFSFISRAVASHAILYWSPSLYMSHRLSLTIPKAPNQ